MSTKQDKYVRSDVFLIKHLKKLANDGFLEIVSQEKSVDFLINFRADWTILSSNDRFAYALFKVAKGIRGQVVAKSDKQLSRYIAGGDIPLSVVAATARVASINLQWIIDGKSEPFSDLEDVDNNIENEKAPANYNSFVQIPRYDVHLSAGDGHLNDHKATLLDYIPFTREFLQKKLNRSSIDDLSILEATGDSMLPTISDGDLVLIDESDKTEIDGIFAYVQGDFARIKRLRFMMGGKIEIVSDNEIYSSETLSKSDLEQFHIIGRVRWVGHTV